MRELVPAEREGDSLHTVGGQRCAALLASRDVPAPDEVVLTGTPASPRQG